MEMEYNHLSVESLNKDFWDSIKDRFAGKTVSIIVKEEENEPLQSSLFDRMEILRKKLRSVKVDPSIDLSDLANDVNL